MEVRPATTADAVALARVHAAAWKFAYPGIMADDFLDQIDESRWARGWERNLEEGAAVTLVGTTADGQVNGFASVGAPQDPDAPASGQLWAINLHPSAIGTGLGKFFTTPRSRRYATPVTAPHICGSRRRTAGHGTSMNARAGCPTAWPGRKRSAALLCVRCAT